MTIDYRAKRQDRDRVDQLAEEFLERRRRGEHASVEEYARRNPGFDARIRHLFPTLLLVEECAER